MTLFHILQIIFNICPNRRQLDYHIASAFDPFLKKFFKLIFFQLQFADSQTQRTDSWLPEGRRLGNWVKKVKGQRSTD